MNFQVPQFIEVEDKIIGPLSFKQFLYIAGGAGLGYLAYNLPLFFGLRLAIALLCAGFGLSLAFYRVNNRPLIHTIESAFWYYMGSRLYLWKKEARPVKKIEAETESRGLNLKTLSDSRLKDLSWSLDVNEKIK